MTARLLYVTGSEITAKPTTPSEAKRPPYVSRSVHAHVEWMSVEYIFDVPAADLVQYYPGTCGMTIESPDFDPFSDEEAEHQIVFRGLVYTAKDAGPAEPRRVAVTAVAETVRWLHAAGITMYDLQKSWPGTWEPPGLKAIDLTILDAFAMYYGRGWKHVLEVRWERGGTVECAHIAGLTTEQGERLHYLRNVSWFGPRGLKKYKPGQKGERQ